MVGCGDDSWAGEKKEAKAAAAAPAKAEVKQNAPAPAAAAEESSDDPFAEKPEKSPFDVDEEYARSLSLSPPLPSPLPFLSQSVR